MQVATKINPKHIPIWSLWGLKKYIKRTNKFKITTSFYQQQRLQQETAGR
jgi:hypothetical protein